MTVKQYGLKFEEKKKSFVWFDLVCVWVLDQTRTINDF